MIESAIAAFRAAPRLLRLEGMVQYYEWELLDAEEGLVYLQTEIPFLMIQNSVYVWSAHS